MPKTTLSTKQINNICNLLRTTNLTHKEIAERVKCSKYHVGYQNKKLRKGKAKPPEEEPGTKALSSELTNSFLMEALIRLAEMERNITGTDRKSILLRISCMDAMIRVRNSIEASRDVGPSTIILAEAHPTVAQGDIDFVRGIGGDEAALGFINNRQKNEAAVKEQLKKGGGIIT